jgi:hypothetical protein
VTAGHQESGHPLQHLFDQAGEVSGFRGFRWPLWEAAAPELTRGSRSLKITSPIDLEHAATEDLADFVFGSPWLLQLFVLNLSADIVPSVSIDRLVCLGIR